MRTARARVLNVLAAVEEARDAHPELGERLTWPRLQRVLGRERIGLMMLPIFDKADVLGAPPYFIITLNSSTHPRHHTRHAAHEYAHIRLHFGTPGETERNLSPCQRGDAREWEAELFATLLLLGPDATIEHPDAARLAARIVGHGVRLSTPQQLPLGLPEKAPVYKPRPQPFQHEREYQRRLVRKGSKRLTKMVRDDPSAGDVDRIKFYDEARGTTRFTDVAGRLWWIYNYRVVTDAAESRRWELVRDFMSPDIGFRFFVNSLGLRQVYRFANRREERAYRVRHLDRQLAESNYVPDRLGPRVHRQRSVRNATDQEPIED
jgi:hypothetical protein